MKLTIDSRELRRGLGHVARAISSRGPLPILSHIHMDARDGVMTFRATDLEIGIESVIPCQVTTPGTLCVPAKTMGEIAAKLPSAEVEMTMDDANRVTLRCGRARFSVAGMAGADFPALPLIEGASIELPREVLLLALRQVLPCAAPEDKAVISGLFLEVLDGRLTVVGTDGYRLARRHIARPEAQAMALVIPARTMKEIESQLKTLDVQSVTLTASTNQVSLALGDRRLTARLTDGMFPPYSQIIPKDFAKEAIVDRESFVAAVERVSVMAEDREAHVLRCAFEAGELTVSAGTKDAGDASEALPVTYDFDPIAITWNADYLLAAIKAATGTTIRVSMNAALSAVVLQSPDDPDHLALVMPLNRV